MSSAQGASWLPRLVCGAGALTALGAGAMGLAGLAAPLAELALGGGALALIGALLPGGRRNGEEERKAMAVPKPSEPAVGGEELKRLRAEIERHEKLEQELTRSKQAAEAAMMAKGEFLATMSHEIRTPLNGIVPLLDILMSTPLQVDQKEYVQTAFSSAQALLRIVDDILDYSQLEANKLSLESVGLNLRDVLDGVMRLLEKSAESKSLGFSLTIDPAVRLPVRGDPIRLRQILTNLVSNAIKFTDRGSVTVHLSRRGETRNHHELRFEVRDTGVGITAESAAKLFKPFSQADTSTTREFGGTGLGLVICKRIVDLMGGQIGVESQPGQGSTFWFNVPMLKAIGDMGSREQGLVEAKVLLLTADPGMQRRLSVSLPNWGAKLTLAGNTQEALTKLRAASKRGGDWGFDLALVDLASVRTTFLALHRAAQREADLSELKLVYLQGSDPLPPDVVPGERILTAPRSVGETELRRLLERFLSDAAPANPPGTEAEIRVLGLGDVMPTPRPMPAITPTPIPLPEPPRPAPPVHAAPPPTPAAQARTYISPTPAASQGAPAPAAAGSTEPAKVSGHVLLVEDNPVNRQVAQRLLAMAGVTTDSAENGQEALDMLAANRYDAVLMDCQMPVLDGYQATQRRRELEGAGGLPRIPIIAMTANAMVGDRERCLDSGMDDYITKPINRGVLSATLQRWLASASAAPPSVPAASAAAARPRLAAAPPAAAAPAALPQPPAAPAAAAPRVVPSVPAISMDVVEDLRDIMGAEFDALVGVFLEDAPKSLAKLEVAAARGEVDAMVGPAHSLKSTSANLGAMELSAQAKHIEFGARQRTLQDLPALVAALTAEFRRAEAELKRIAS